ncbi:sensor histidine kinase [Hufsiella ginkgonis]|uniref:histidine kinase n=1 Tax=Hufsiella ginkgonis TaxID=2695274 RepID=A0A7K1Y3D8_9SPHI|nr:HAMP domain-containing sensor histidine kinase [Hufsiella ginkgonis]MXV17196.1 two-component sensor histidine kinase [Hufsiella ginkgonis]
MRKPLAIFYFLILYAFAELVWWGYILIREQPHRKGMILGEGAVFLLLFFVGAHQLHKSLRKERKLHAQQRNFLLSVTHELKSPLASIKLYVETILKRQLEREQVHSFLRKSLKDIERLDDLVENMLIAAKIENKSYSFPKEEFNFSELVVRITERLQVHTCSTQTIRAEIKPDILLVGDRFALTSVVTNLVENAVKYSPPCAEVLVTLSKNGPTVSLEVADHGAGIEDAEKLRIFDKFYRVGSEDTRKTKGTGLGLFIVKQVLTHHQAQIRVRNNKPEGTIFEVIFNTNAN